jgi:hypothetical protein
MQQREALLDVHYAGYRQVVASTQLELIKLIPTPLPFKLRWCMTMGDKDKSGQLTIGELRVGLEPSCPPPFV